MRALGTPAALPPSHSPLERPRRWWRRSQRARYQSERISHLRSLEQIHGLKSAYLAGGDPSGEGRFWVLDKLERLECRRTRIERRITRLDELIAT